MKISKALVTKQLKEEEVYFGLCSRGMEFLVHHGGANMTGGTGSWVVTLHLHTGGRAREQEVGQVFQPSKSIPSDDPSPTRFHLLKVP